MPDTLPENKLKFEENKGFFEDPVWDKDRIIKTYNSEIEYLKQKLYWI